MTLVLVVVGVVFWVGVLLAVTPRLVDVAARAWGRRRARVEHRAELAVAGRHRRDQAGPDAVTMTGFMRALTAEGDARYQAMQERAQEDR